MGTYWRRCGRAGRGGANFDGHARGPSGARVRRGVSGGLVAAPHACSRDRGGHSDCRGALAGQGVLGLAALAGVTVLGFYAVRKVQDRRLAAALGAGLTAVVVSQQFTSFTLPTALFFYLTVALLVGQAFLPVQHAVV